MLKKRMIIIISFREISYSEINLLFYNPVVGFIILMKSNSMIQLFSSSAGGLTAFKRLTGQVVVSGTVCMCLGIERTLGFLKI